VRVGFIGDPVTGQSGGRIFKRSPLSLLSTAHAWRGSAPGAGGDLYAGVAELNPVQVQELLTECQARGIRLAVVIDIDKSDGAQPLSTQERSRLAAWMAEKGFPGPEQFEGQIDYVQRLQRILNDYYSMDRTLLAVEGEVTIMSRFAQRITVP